MFISMFNEELKKENEKLKEENQELKIKITGLEITEASLKYKIKTLENTKPLLYSVTIGDKIIKIIGDDTHEHSVLYIYLKGRCVAQFKKFDYFTTEDIK